MAKKDMTPSEATTASEHPATEIKQNASYFLKCLRRVSFFLHKNAHVLDMPKIQDDVAGLGELSDVIDKLKDFD